MFAPWTPTNNELDCREPSWNQNCMHSSVWAIFGHGFPKAMSKLFPISFSWLVSVPIYVAQAQIPALLVCAIESWYPACLRPPWSISQEGSVHHMMGYQRLHCLPQKASCPHWNWLSQKWHKTSPSGQLILPPLCTVDNLFRATHAAGNQSITWINMAVSDTKISKTGGLPLLISIC